MHIMRISGWIIEDDCEEFWCYDSNQRRVFHVGAEIEHAISNGFGADSLEHAIEILIENGYIVEGRKDL